MSTSDAEFSTDPNQFDLRRISVSPLVGSLEFHAATGSTQEIAKQLAARPAMNLPILVLASRQTAGRGRGSSRWWSSRGGLTFSLVFDPPAARPAVEEQGPVTLAAALAVCEVARRLAPNIPCGIKWPNDVYLAGKKVCGSLLEIPHRAQHTPSRIILGLGMNVNNRMAEAPDDVAHVATSLRDAVGGRPFSLTDVLLIVLECLSVELQALAVRDCQQAARWRERSLLNGRQVTVQLGSRCCRGRCVEVADDGALVVQTATGRERLVSGTVSDVQPPLDTGPT